MRKSPKEIITNIYKDTVKYFTVMKSVTLVNLVPQVKDSTVPLGPLYIAAILKDMGCHVDFRDYQLSKYKNLLSQKNILNFLSDSEDVLGIGCYFNMLPFLLPSLEKIKEDTPEKTIILGGPGPSSVAEKLMENFSCIDCVVRGEGETTMKELANNTPLNQIKGIIYRDNGTVVSTPQRERITNLDSLPFPAYDMIDVSLYDQAGVVTARGCPYHCSFCEVASLWGYHTEQRRVDQVIKEIRLLQNKGVTSLHINDDTFVLNREWVLAFCERLQKESIDITWRCLGRINLMDEELLSAMGKAGCTGVQYGVESGSERVLKLVGKQISVPQIKKVVNMSAEYIEYVLSTFMWGFPFETMGDFFQTMYLMGVLAEMDTLVKLLFLSPAPLSPIYREYRDKLKFDEKFVPNLLWGEYQDTLPAKEKNDVIKFIREYPEVFAAFYHIYTPEVEKKYQFLKKAGIV